MSLNKPFKLNQCVVDPSENILELNDGTRKTLQPKYIEVLAYLASQFPRTVERQELIEKVWEGNFYVGEKSLNNAIWNVRNELKPTGIDYIETVRKKGYRLLVQPIYIDVTPLADTSANQQQRTFNNFGLPKNLITISLATLLAFFLIWQLPWFQTQKAPVEITDLTLDPGREVYASVSPNQQDLIYSWRQIGQAPNIFVRDMKNPNAAPRQLTKTTGYEGRPIWHPNGEVVFFQRKNWNYTQCDIIKLNTLTQKETVLAPCYGEINFAMDISPDGNTLAYTYNESESTSATIHLLDLQQRGHSKALQPCDSNCFYRDVDVAFSPSGEQLLVARTPDEELNIEFFVYNLVTNEIKRVGRTDGKVKGLTWHPDGERIVYSAEVHGKRNAYVLELASEKVTPLDFPGMSFPKFIPNSNELVYHHWQSNNQLASIVLNDSVPAAPFPLMQSNFAYKSPHYSVANDKIAYISNESGFEEIWTADKNRQQITTLGSHLTFPRWSNDGQFIAFVGPAVDDKKNNLYVVNVQSKVVKIINSEFHKHFRPSWLNDDSGILAGAKGNNGFGLYSFSLDEGDASLLLKKKVKFAIQASDGDIWYSPGRNKGLWKFSPNANARNAKVSQELDAEAFHVRYNWDLFEDKVYFQQDFPAYHQVASYDFRLGKLQALVKLPVGTVSRENGSTVMPNQQLVYTQVVNPKVDIKKLSHPAFR